MTHHLWVL